MSAIPSTTLTRLLEEQITADDFLPPRRRRRLGPTGISSPLFSEPVEAGRGSIRGLIESAEAFGPLAPVDLLQGQIQSGRSQTVMAQNRETAAGLANEQGFTQSTIGGTATAIALQNLGSPAAIPSRLSTPASLTNSLRDNIHQR